MDTDGNNTSINLNVSALDDVRGFVDNGYKTLQNASGDLSELVSI